MKKLVLLLFLLIIPQTFASSHYTLEHAEELKPLIKWRDYGPDAFGESIEQNKPIFLMLTAPSWCYWCHVYSSEDYLYHPSVYPYINENFISIYVDADKRQDLTRQLLEGGWPSTTVMAPNGERLFGYSGVRPVSNMLVNLQQSVDYVNTQGFANIITYNYEELPQVILTDQQIAELINSYNSFTLRLYDSTNGGFGNGQKFPQGRTLDFALDIYETTGDNQWLNIVQNTLNNQYTNLNEIETNYNIFDPVEGGFHRYGTQSDWSPPHYEKMLYDNARLLKAYHHLLQITPEDPVVNNVVNKTLNFIEQNWYDKENGGFYGNSDVNGEEEYYGKVDRPKDKPRVEKTKYTDWNTDAVLTYMYLWKTTNNEKYKEIAEKTLNFLETEMITENGAYHFKNEDNEPSVRGNLLDNAYLLLAFVEGYETLNDERYLKIAKQLADYSLENLYDWNSGGFFERNSPDKELYAPGQNIVLTKPTAENGIITFALLKLYQQTNDPLYLNAAIKTYGNQVNNVGSLDRGYYFIKSGQLILENRILRNFTQIRDQAETEENIRQESFWLNDLLNYNVQSNEITTFVVSDEGLSLLSSPILFLMLIALVAGFVSFASPCTLPILPAYIAYTFRSSDKNIKLMTISFFLGLSIVFTLLGMSATLIGNFLRTQLTLFSQIAGVALMFFGFYILRGKGFTGINIKKGKPTSYIGSFFVGTAFGISWTPCVGPILVSILLLASTTGSVFTGGLLLFIYALGLAIPLMIISSYIDRIDKESKLWRIIKGRELIVNILGKELKFHTNSLISGLLFIVLGYLMFSGILFTFNQYVVTTSFQKYIFGLEEALLRIVE